MWARALAVAAGIWLMVAPSALGYLNHVAEKSDRIAGPIGAALAFVAIWAVVRALRWATIPVGLWLVVAPWFLGFPADATVSSVVSGAVFIGTAFVRGKVESRFGGGWMSLADPLPGR